jgi:hypothetical protein
MTVASPSAVSTADPTQLPDSFLLCYEILNPASLVWPVRLYKVVRADGSGQSHSDRGEIKQAIWELRKQYAHLCREYGFVVDVDEETVAVPTSWELPSGDQVGAYRVTLGQTVTTNPEMPAHRGTISSIVREAMKRHFKDHNCDVLGALWQDYDRFCQVPPARDGAEFHFCRKLGVAAKVLRGHCWVLQILISTVTVDTRTLEDYYQRGEVAMLAAMMKAKQANRRTRRNRAVAVRVLKDVRTPPRIDVRALELDDPGVIIGHGSLSRHEQMSLADGTAKCRPYGKQAVDVPLGHLRLILDSQITQTDHTETIIGPRERQQLAQHLRDFVQGCDVHGREIHLAETPVDSSLFPVVSPALPSLRVRNKAGGEHIVSAPSSINETTLQERGRSRLEHVRRNGFLQQRPINPLLAWPKPFGWERARRMMNDLNYILKCEGIDYRFGGFLYTDVEHLRSYIETKEFDTLLAVLPEGWAEGYRGDNTHEQIKQRIDVPSQCIHHDHTLPESWVSRRPGEFMQAQPKLANRIRQRYELCVWNLLVKHHWVPFAPNDPFHYNVHVGLDVGGQHNNRAMACLGYGFMTPREGLYFRPEEIPINVQQAEPIPTDCLYWGLLHLFETTYFELEATGCVPSFDKALFFRDGRLLGDGDDWNERDALEKLHRVLRERGWVSDQSTWTAVEVMKQAEEWRLLRRGEDIVNPLVGQCIFPFEEENMALVCTTGAPYLSQGTASPLKICTIDIYGHASLEEVVRDLLWEADMCFTKPDTGMSLPWVLHVADTGALQLARSYRLSGITV